MRFDITKLSPAMQEEARRQMAGAPPGQPPPKQVMVKAVIAQSTDESKLNKTEAGFLSELRSQGHQWVGIQAVTLKLGDDCRYTPDFFVVDQDGQLTAFEVKGFMRDDALVKLKTASRNFTWVKFVLVKRSGGIFTREQVKA